MAKESNPSTLFWRWDLPNQVTPGPGHLAGHKTFLWSPSICEQTPVYEQYSWKTPRQPEGTPNPPQTGCGYFSWSHLKIPTLGDQPWGHHLQTQCPKGSLQVCDGRNPGFSALWHASLQNETGPAKGHRRGPLGKGTSQILVTNVSVQLLFATMAWCKGRVRGEPDR